MKYGPSRGEYIFRLIASLAGLALLGVAIAVRGVEGAAWIEIVGIGGGFLGGSAIWSAWQLFRRPKP